MNIAKDEADRVADEQMMSYFHYSNGFLSHLDAKLFGKRMYVAGRTADPTAAEIEAAINEWDRHGYCHRVGTPIVCMCGVRLTDGHSYDVHLVRAMLEAARKAVSE